MQEFEKTEEKSPSFLLRLQRTSDTVYMVRRRHDRLSSVPFVNAIYCYRNTVQAEKYSVEAYSQNIRLLHSNVLESVTIGRTGDS